VPDQRSTTKLEPIMSDEQIRGGWKLDQREGTRRALKYPDGPGKIIIVNHDGRGWWDPRAFCKALPRRCQCSSARDAATSSTGLGHRRL